MLQYPLLITYRKASNKKETDLHLVTESKVTKCFNEPYNKNAESMSQDETKRSQSLFSIMYALLMPGHIPDIS